MVKVTPPTGPQFMLNNPSNGINVFTYTPSQTGNYQFQCLARGDSGDALCPVTGGVVTEPSSACIDPITNLTITNYTSGQTVGNQTITLQGQVE